MDPVAFEQKFGAPVSELSTLLDKKAVTIGRLMDIAPAGVLDPSPTLYDTTLYSMGGVLFVACGLAMLIQPVDEKFVTSVPPKSKAD